MEINYNSMCKFGSHAASYSPNITSSIGSLMFGIFLVGIFSFHYSGQLHFSCDFPLSIAPPLASVKPYLP